MAYSGRLFLVMTLLVAMGVLLGCTREVEVVREVPVEVERAVVQEVPVEITKEVPVEITREIPVEITREVPVEVVREVPCGRSSHHGNHCG